MLAAAALLDTWWAAMWLTTAPMATRLVALVAAMLATLLVALLMPLMMLATVRPMRAWKMMMVVPVRPVFIAGFHYDGVRLLFGSRHYFFCGFPS
mgnify:CR=1 FL=1